MDIEIEGPVDDLELMFTDEDDELLAFVAAATNHPTVCSGTGTL